MLTPSQHPQRAEISHLWIMTRDGRQAGLSRPRNLDDADGDFPSTDNGDRIEGTITVELAHMLAVTD